VLDNWELMVPRFVKVMPTDYKRVLQARRAARKPIEAIAEQLQQTAGAGGRA
jgi:glutamate synthase (NADPH/NADH) large chain